MRTCLTLLLAAVLCTEQARSLKCYTCTEQASNAQCLIPTDCADKYCLTTYASGGIGTKGGQRITKKCSPVCPTTNLNMGVAAISTTCCEHSLCNISGASSVKTSSVVMATGILASLTYILRIGL
uniref:UPAR/Ly6 domain-containing protein n=1 Tax=Pelusios castaneus TaxID=367368 RepID=A0A8C8RFX3_9SAUR